MNELNSIKDFVLSLEANKLSGEQQAVLLTGESELFGGLDTGGCTNNGCTNSTPDCATASNSSCTNIANCKCPTGSTGSTGSTGNTGCVLNSQTCTNSTCGGTNGKSATSGYSMLGFPGFGFM